MTTCLMLWRPPFLGRGAASAVRTFGGKASDAAATPATAAPEPSSRRRLTPDDWPVVSGESFISSPRCWGEQRLMRLRKGSSAQLTLHWFTRDGVTNVR